MEFGKIGITSVKPVAVLYGGINGPRFIAEVRKADGNTELRSVTPNNNYDLSKSEVVEQYILESAIAKHGYESAEIEPVDEFGEYEEYLRELCREGIQRDQ